jgi:PIN domain nuclease of toxin-antitoxin system
VLDASAVLALLLDEPGCAAAEPYIGVGGLSVVNYSEVMARFSDLGASAEFIQAQIDELALTLIPFEQGTALVAGMLRAPTREFGLSFADRACLATAGALGLPAITADHAWAELDIGVRVELIR